MRLDSIEDQHLESDVRRPLRPPCTCGYAWLTELADREFAKIQTT